MKTLKYASFEGHPCVYNETRGWVLFDRNDGWRELPIAEIHHYAGIMSEERFRAYRDLPPLPSDL
jgi:hypothetical protein